MLKKFRGFLLECLKPAQARHSERMVEGYFREGTERGVCAFCGEEDEVSHYFLALTLMEKASHPALFQGEGPVCRGCAFVLHAVGKVTGVPYVFFTTNEERSLPLESVRDLNRIKPMDAVFYIQFKDQRLPGLLRCLPSPVPEKSLTLNVVRGGGYVFFHVTPQDLETPSEGRDLRGLVLRGLLKKFGG